MEVDSTETPQLLQARLGQSLAEMDRNQETQLRQLLQVRLGQSLTESQVTQMLGVLPLLQQQQEQQQGPASASSGTHPSGEWEKIDTPTGGQN